MSAPTVLALDLSLTSTGYAYLRFDGVPHTGRIRTSTDGVERLARLSAALRELVDVVAPDLVVLEGYAYGRTNKAHDVGEWGGVARLTLFVLGVPYAVVPPATVKMYATSRGNASKPEVLAEAIRRLGYAGASDDEADALWLLAAALEHYGAPLVDLPAAHRKALTKPTKSGKPPVAWPELAA